MTTYQITNTVSGVDLGTYQAASEREALDAMARTAGYTDYADLQRQVPAKAGEIVAAPVASQP